MVRDGFYKIAFQTPLGSGAGVVVLNAGKLRGGDSRITYSGTYVQNGDDFTATVETDAHTNVPGMGSVFGIDRAHVSLKGKSVGDSATMTGTAREAPGVQLQAALSRISD